NVTAQQSYLLYSSTLLKNVNVGLSGCVLTSTLTPDNTVFDAALQNEACNGPGTCTFRSLVVPPGSMAFASGALNNPAYNGPDFRAAQVAFCAVAPGVATIHWQFSPPDPIKRDSEIVDENGIIVSVRTCYADYTVTVAGATFTPTDTNTPTNTPTFTPTNTP